MLHKVQFGPHQGAHGILYTPDVKVTCSVAWLLHSQIVPNAQNRACKKNRSWIQILDMVLPILTFSLIVTFYLLIIENRTKRPLTQLSYYCLEWTYYFWKKKKKADISKIKGALALKGTFFLNYICAYLNTKFQVSSIILLSMEVERDNFTPCHHHKRSP